MCGGGGEGLTLPPSGEVRGGMGLSAASPPGKALPGAGSEMRWRVAVCAVIHARLCASQPAGPCRHGTPCVSGSAAAGGRGQ